MKVAANKIILFFAFCSLCFAFFAPACLKLPDKEFTPVKNMPPVIEPVAQVIVNEGEEIVIEPQISDPDGDILTYSFGGWAPGGYSKDLSIPTWRYTASYDDAGEYSVWVAAIDEKTKDGKPNQQITTVRKDILIKVNNVNRPPQCPGNPLQTVDELSTLAFTFRASDPDIEDNLRLAYTFKWQGQMPGGVTGFAFNNLDNLVDFSYSPIFGARGSYVMEFSVTDPSVPSYTIACSIPLEVQDVLLWEKAGTEAGEFPSWVSQAVVNSLVVDPYSSRAYAGLSSFFDPLSVSNPIPDQGYGVYAYSPLADSWEEILGLSELRVLDLRLSEKLTQFYVFAATTAGIYRYDGHSWQEESSGIPHKYRRIFSLGLDSQGKLWAGPGWFNGPLYFSSDDSQNWYPSGITDIQQVYNLAFGGNQMLASVFWKSEDIFYKTIIQSLDLGTTWGEMSFFRSLTSRVIAFDPADPQKIYVGVENQGIYRTVDGGNTWLLPIQIGNTNSYPRAILPIAYHDYPGTVLVGLTEKGVWRSRDGGSTFTAQNNGLPDSISIRSIAVDPNNLDRLYIGTEYHGVYRTKLP